MFAFLNATPTPEPLPDGVYGASWAIGVGITATFLCVAFACAVIYGIVYAHYHPHTLPGRLSC